ncbi:MAG: ferrous iron transport protein A [Victivallales bacterium]|nr:ferrous iron transport protein A [Victivallales bacterium]MBO7620098.1 ferrous iron transport protein A [Victivallales bacterium]
MMPLNLAMPGEELLIRKVGGSPEVRKHLEDMGFIAGGTTTVVSALNGNLIVKVKESRVALSEELARKIMV